MPGPQGESGAPGEDGALSLIRLVDEPVGESCEFGGTWIEVGIDLDASGALDDSEVSQSALLCTADPMPASPCSAGTWDHDGDPSTPCALQTDCVAGQYVADPGDATTNRTCALCAAGTYSSGTNDVSCTDCAAGSYADTSGATSCVAHTDCGTYTFAAGTATADSQCDPPYTMKATAAPARLYCANTGMGVRGGAWTIEYWVRIHQEFAGGHIFTMNENYAAYAIKAFAYSDGTTNNITYNDTSGSHNLAFPFSLSVGEWHHVGMTYDGAGTGRLYVDGAVVATQTGAAPDIRATSPFVFGKAAGYAAYSVAPVHLAGFRYSGAVRYPDGTSFDPAIDWAVDGSTIAQYLVAQPFAAGLVDEAGGDNNCTLDNGWE